MKLPHRRQFLHLAAGAAALPALPQIARAQSYPSRPINLVITFPAGGAPDIIGRLTGQWLSERLGQPFVIENRPGFGGNIATEYVVRASPDGYTILMPVSTNAVNATLYPNLKFNFMRDIAPVAHIGRTNLVIVVNPSFPAKTLPEFIACAKANPRKINFASAGAGSLSHVAAALFAIMAGVELVHVPYRGEALGVTDLLAGQVPVMFQSATGSLPYIRAGTLRPLSVTTAARWDGLPDVPAVAEFVPGYEATAWHGIGAPKGTPADIVDRLNQEINAALADPKMKARFADVAYTPVPMTLADFEKLIADETDKWAKVIRAANIQPE